ncbi:sugar ABC transporter ATP-binding protein [Roseobacter sp.]|uniref:sugar ABC transporter ATP-binding protein n=1 Tax=Roseobacter sp. TaxID=1907202 RepID=UPI0029676086|nr:sugar ABC transporter ATP-binding protein [Roseobacter sp.]MDW3182625.1 sugar ABC transporter ATP-binding protein [Roseobacter sp.]
MSTAQRDPIQAHVQLTGVTKRYGGVTALDNVDFECELGSVHAVLGENGAGKSTLIKIMSGVVQPDEGEIRLNGAPVSFSHPAAANAQGIVCIFQELSLLSDLSVADNISIADPPRRFGLIDGKAQRWRAEELLARIGCEDVNPMSRVRDLPLSRRQMVEIAKALAKNPNVLILDEATSALTAADVETVFDILRRLRDDGISILTISHRMHEIEAIADKCSVFRNGRHIETFQQGARSEGEIVQMMIGREITAHFPPKPPPPDAPKPMLKLEKYSWEDKLKSIDLSVGAGEIVGLGGLDGQGQKELLLGLFGVLKGTSGQVTVQGKAVDINSPQDAKRAGVDLALIPEDRKTEGLMLPMSIADNLTIASLKRLSRGLFVDGDALTAAVEDGIQRMQIKVGSNSDPVSTLSGGNQQKVVIAKWLMTDPKIILLNDPTRGIDVGTKQEIYRLLRNLAETGASIIYYSTDYEELIGCCDRVAVMYDGEIVRELQGDEINERNIIASALKMDEAAE